MIRIAHDLDRVDPRVTDRRDRTVAVAGGPALLHRGDIVGESRPGELARVRIDDRIGEEVAAGSLGEAVAIGDGAVDVRVDPRGTALADALDAPRHECGGQVVEEDTVGEFAGEAQHPGVQGGDHELRTPVAETHAGKGSLPYDHPLSLGGAGVSGTLAANQVAPEADLVIGIGTRFTDFPTASKTAFQDPNVRFVNINVAEFDAYKHAAVPLVGDDLTYIDFPPIHQQLLAGQVAPSGINWSGAMEKSVAKELVSDATDRKSTRLNSSHT